ncbi:LysR substrate-binding domain-containing protein [Comamonas terrigena]|uniref:LysR substrate-binding domain-containing protein n=1 Tax=Comamonas terrigena TaxID=32013 RepID=UPI002355D48F|nr:LysR substrate-binding domain-containing protein [Comamonas terrigena]
MRDLDLSNLRLFVTVCATRSLAQAGAQHHLVGSAVSKRMQQLEAQLGSVLLARHRRGVLPTAAGEVLLGHAKAILERADSAVQELSGLSSGIKGEVRIMATLSAILGQLPDDIADFLADPTHRQIDVSVTECNGREIVRSLRSGQTAVGLCWDREALDGLHVRSYMQDRLVAVVAPHSVLAHRSQCSFEDTLDFDHIGMPASTALRQSLDQAAVHLGRVIRYRMNVTTIDSVLRGVRAGLGLAVVPDSLLRNVSDGLRYLPLIDSWARRQLVVCSRPPQELSPASQLLVQHLEAVGLRDLAATTSKSSVGLQQS